VDYVHTGFDYRADKGWLTLSSTKLQMKRVKDLGLGLAGATSVGRTTIFRRIYRQNRWGSSESVSGVGSHLDQTEVVRRQLPQLVADYRIRSMLDAPCGDVLWLSRVEGLALDRYIGVDIVPDLIKRLKADPPMPNAEFHRLDVVSSPLPRADVILCRDLLVHLSDQQIYRCLRNFRRSGADYLLVTTFPAQVNSDIVNARWRPVNLGAPPFAFPPPLTTIVEGSTQRSVSRGLDYGDKELALWRLADLPV
jgi:Methyltransferase domain